MGYCRLTNVRINLVIGDPSCIRPQHETTRSHSVSIGGWTGHVFASVLFQPLHDAAPLEIVYALSLRDWRHPLAHADHAGVRRDAIGVSGATALTCTSRVTNRGSDRGATYGNRRVLWTPVSRRLELRARVPCLCRRAPVDCLGLAQRESLPFSCLPPRIWRFWHEVLPESFDRLAPAFCGAGNKLLRAFGNQSHNLRSFTFS